MSNGTISYNITKIESFDLPSVSEDSLIFFLSSEMDELFRSTKPSTENSTTESPNTEDCNPTPIPQQPNHPASESPNTEYYSGELIQRFWFY